MAAVAYLDRLLGDEAMCGALNIGEGHSAHGLGIHREHLRQTQSLVLAQCSVGFVQRDGFRQAMAQHGQRRNPVERGVAGTAATVTGGSRPC